MLTHYFCQVPFRRKSSLLSSQKGEKLLLGQPHPLNKEDQTSHSRIYLTPQVGQENILFNLEPFLRGSRASLKTDKALSLKVYRNSIYARFSCYRLDFLSFYHPVYYLNLSLHWHRFKQDLYLPSFFNLIYSYQMREKLLREKCRIITRKNYSVSEEIEPYRFLNQGKRDGERVCPLLHPYFNSTFIPLSIF